MKQFVFAYHGGKPDSEEQGKAIMAKWQTWMEGNADRFAVPGDAVGMSKTVSASGVEDNGGSNPLMGYSVINAEDMEAAITFAKTCPHLEMSTGTIEVAEVIVM